MAILIANRNGILWLMCSHTDHEDVKKVLDESSSNYRLVRLMEETQDFYRKRIELNLHIGFILGQSKHPEDEVSSLAQKMRAALPCRQIVEERYAPEPGIWLS